MENEAMPNDPTIEEQVQGLEADVHGFIKKAICCSRSGDRPELLRGIRAAVEKAADPFMVG